VNSILSVGLVVGALAMSGAFVWLAILSALARMLVYLLCTVALLKVRAGAPKRKRAPAETLMRWAAPAIAASLCIWAIAQAKLDAWVFLGAFAAAGSLLYALSRWRLVAKPS
jgi:amino acid transporter